MPVSQACTNQPEGQLEPNASKKQVFLFSKSDLTNGGNANYI